MSSRLEGLDLARFIALIGMAMVNFRMAMSGPDDAVTGGFFADISHTIDGRAAALFVVLAGIGLGLGYARKEWDQTLTITLKRAAFLLVAGLINYTIFVGDILHYYAFYFLIGVAFLRAPNWLLALTIFGLMADFVIMALILDYETGWNFATFDYAGFWSPRGFIRHLFFNGIHPVFPWLAFFLFGIWLSRLDLRLRAVQGRLLLGGGLTYAFTMVLSFAMIDVAIDEDTAILFATDPMPPMPLYMLAGGAMASAITGACLLIAPWLKSLGLLRLFTRPGRQTLTLYIAHIVIGMGMLEANGMIGGQSAGAALIVAGIFCLAAILYAHLWAQVFKRGPLEAMMRRLAG